MRELLYTTAKDIITYKKLEINYPVNELHVYRGANRSGKSIAFSLLPLVGYHAPPMDNKKNTAKKLHQKNSLVRHGIKIDEDIYHIEQKGRTNGVGYTIYKHAAHETFDPKKHDIRIRHDVKAEIQKIYGQTEEQFYSLTYLSGSRPSVLQTGTAVQRRAFFENIFNLDAYDKIRSKVHNKLVDLKKIKTTRDFVVSEIERLQTHFKETYKTDNVEILNKRARTLKNKIRAQKTDYKIQYAEYEKLKARLEKLERTQTYLDDLNYPDKTQEFLETELEKVLKRKETSQKKYEKLRGLHKEYNQLKPLHDQRSKYEAAYKKLAKIKPIAFYTEQLDLIEDRISQAKILLKAAQRGKELIDQRAEFIEHKTVLPTKEIISLLSKTVGELGSLESTIKQLSKIKGQKECPTCGSELHHKNIDQTLKQLNKQVETLNEKIEELENISQFKKFDDALKALYEEHPNLLENQWRKAYIEDLKNQDIYQRHLEHAALKQRVRIKLKALKLDPLPDIPEDLDQQIETSKKSLNSLADRQEKIKADLVNWKRIGSVDPQSITSKIKVLKKKLEPLSLAITNYVTTVDELSLKKSLLTRDIEEYNKHLSKIKDFDRELSDYKIYDALYHAYGPKGIRVDQIRNFAKMYEDRLNDYSSLIFPEDIYFEINITETAFDILATRNNRTSDVILLSGSESRCFVLLSMLSILSLLPSDMRLSVCILDELESQMDENSRILFTNEFLLKLKSIIPSLIIVTPLSAREFNIPCADKEWLVKKTNGESKIYAH